MSSSSSTFMTFLAILVVLLPLNAVKGDNSISPILSPYFDNICNEVNCGKGSCVEALGSPFNFKCECNSGWKRTRLDNETDLEFLPCVIPDCTLDYSCMPAAPPAPAIPYNLSFFDPCYWIYCGEGTCTKNASYTHTCTCNSGSANLLNVSVYPCYSDCALGSDCGKLGITVSGKTSTTPSSTSSSNSQATSFLPGKFHWMALSLMSIAMVLLK